MQKNSRFSGRQQHVRNLETVENVLERIENSPQTSTRKIAATIGVSHNTVWKILKEEQLHPYHIQRAQELLPTDFPLRIRFPQEFLEKVHVNPQFHTYVLFTDEANFSKNSIMNFHNEHLWI